MEAFMVEDRVPNEALAQAGLDLMRQAGRPLERIKSNGRAMIYQMTDGSTVRMRTCNDHLLVVLADKDDPDTARLNVEGTDHVLIVMPLRPRSPGAVAGYLVPAQVVADTARSSHRDWLATNPNTKGDNRTWNLWFDGHGPSKANNFAEKWRQYRLGGTASAGLEVTALASTPSASAPKKLGEVIASAKLQIAEAAGVSVERVKITIDV
jgi:hypothetical protein